MHIVVETFRSVGESSASEIRVRPVVGQGFSPSVRVECSKSMRTAFPLGQKLLMDVQLKSRLGTPDWLYANYRDAWQPLTALEAREIILKRR